MPHALKHNPEAKTVNILNLIKFFVYLYTFEDVKHFIHNKFSPAHSFIFESIFMIESLVKTVNELVCHQLNCTLRIVFTCVLTARYHISHGERSRNGKEFRPKITSVKAMRIPFNKIPFNGSVIELPVRRFANERASEFMSNRFKRFTRQRNF